MDGPVGFRRGGRSRGRGGCSGPGIPQLLLGGHHLANVVLGLLEFQRLLLLLLEMMRTTDVVSGDAVEAHAHAAGQARRPGHGHDGSRAEGRGLLLQPCRSVVRCGIGIAFRLFFGIRPYIGAVAVVDGADRG